MSDVLNLNQVDWFSIMDTMMIWIVIIVLMMIIALIIYFIVDMINYNIYVELLRQVGEPYYVEDENGHKELKINYESVPKKAKIYQKKTKGGGIQEYFKIKGTNWDYQNFFENAAFYFRRPSSIFDFKKKGIKLFEHSERGLIPVLMSNPGLDVADVQLNEVIGAISDSLHEKEQLYGEDFWSKYGQIITISFLMAFFIVGMIFMIKYQDVFWKNSMNALQSTLRAVQQSAAPALS